MFARVARLPQLAVRALSFATSLELDRQTAVRALPLATAANLDRQAEVRASPLAMGPDFDPQAAVRVEAIVALGRLRPSMRFQKSESVQ